MKEINKMDGSSGFTYCRGYCGVSCIDGTCPIANKDEYAERCMDIISDCTSCFYHKGCEDCCFYDSEMCVRST